MKLRESHVRQAGFPRWVFVIAAVVFSGAWIVAAEEKPAETPKPQLFRIYATTQPVEFTPTTAPSVGPEKPKKRPWLLLPAFGDEGMTDWLDFDLWEHNKAIGDYRARLYGDRGVSGQHTKMGMAQHDLGFKIIPEDVFFMPTARIRVLDFDTEATLPDTGERFPRCLWDIRAGITTLWPLPLGVMNFTFGSASDKPFASADEMTADITYLIGTMNPIEEGFLFIVNYSNNRDYLNRCILPGFMYRWQPDKRFKIVAGFPYSAFRWEPKEGMFSLSAIYHFPRTVRARAGYRPVESVEIFAGFEWDNQRFFRRDRPDVKDRLWYVEKRLTVGVKWEITEDVYLDISGGYAFDRFFFEGETYEDRGFNRLDIADGPFLGLQFGVRF